MLSWPQGGRRIRESLGEQGRRMPEDVACLCCVDSAHGPMGNPGHGCRQLEKEARRPQNHTHPLSKREKENILFFFLVPVKVGNFRLGGITYSAQPLTEPIVGALWPWQGSQAGWVVVQACGFMT